MNRKYIAITAAALFLPAAALAQNADNAASVDVDFGTVDANSDGMISQDEAQAHEELAAAFSTADTNADGNLTEQEFQVAMNASAMPAGQPHQN